MLFNLQSLLSLTLAVSTLLANDAVAMPHRHQQAHSGLHAKRSDRTGPVKRDALQTLQSEVKSFQGFMSGFVKAGSTDSSSISQLQSQVQDHVQAVSSYISGAGDGSTGPSSAVLQSDANSFKAWIDNWAQDVTYTSSADALNQLSNEVESYEGWLNAWLGLGGPSTGTAPVAPSTGAPLPSLATLQTTTIAQTSTATIITTQTMTGTPPPSSSVAAASSTFSSIFTSLSLSSALASSLSAQPASPTLASSSPPAVATTPASSPSTSSPSSPSSSPCPPGGSSGSSMLAAWWGQSEASSTYNLGDICNDPSYDIVMLSFLNDFFSAGGMPTINLGPSTGEPSTSQSAAGATGLFNGEDLQSDIQACQSSGKKVMLTLGGAAGYSQSQFASDSQAEAFADTVWDLFLGGDSLLRPFPNLKLDGIDVDNENKDQTGYTAFVSALRSKFAEDTSKSYYISGAPQCPQPDQSIPLDAMKQMDWVWVQFYNNPQCNHGTGSPFTDSVSSWSQSLAGSNAKLFVGAIADSSQGSGYISGDDLAAEIKQVQGMGLGNFGGYALWDASLAMQNGGMQGAIKSALS
ncbi:MAG: hypothetical protein LQ340_001816 [Diploschistes diacapsis]|nr:MAG: hypothetical protein LQ340_001816 [Diploschistes diacapsis]